MDHRTFFKGLLMGVCDTIPGISGGTIAFITGIYEKLINSINAFSPGAIKNTLAIGIGKGNKEKFKKDLKSTNLSFLFTLLAGIVVAILLFSKVIEYLLENHSIFVMSFFIGLILSSAIVLFKHIERHHTSNQLMALVGLTLGISLAFIVPTSINPSSLFIFLSGAIAISAMILPGISGSFILLIIGMYEPVIKSVSNISNSIPFLMIFGLGALGGLMTITRIVSYLFKKNKCMTLYTLVGLVIGALSVPIKNIIQQGITISNITPMIILGILGILGGHYISKLGKK